MSSGATESVLPLYDVPSSSRTALSTSAAVMNSATPSVPETFAYVTSPKLRMKSLSSRQSQPCGRLRTVQRALPPPTWGRGGGCRGGGSPPR